MSSTSPTIQVSAQEQTSVNEYQIEISHNYFELLEFDIDENLRKLTIEDIEKKFRNLCKKYKNNIERKNRIRDALESLCISEKMLQGFVEDTLNDKKEALERQYGANGHAPIDPDLIFPEVQTCSLEEIFGSKEGKAGQYSKRTSSAKWDHDELTLVEKRTYRTQMGYGNSMARPSAMKMN